MYSKLMFTANGTQHPAVLTASLEVIFPCKHLLKTESLMVQLWELELSGKGSGQEQVMVDIKGLDLWIQSIDLSYPIVGFLH